MIEGYYFTGYADEIAGKHGAPVHAPKSLFHYTDANGLIGILRNSIIRFSDVLFLNDGSEVAYGLHILDSVIAEELKGMSEGEKVFARKVIERATNHWRTNRAVIFCLSAEKNLLNQWRDYARDVIGYSIEFDPLQLVRREHVNFSPILFKMIYDPETQVKILTALIQRLYEETRKLYSDNFVESDEDESKLVMCCAIQINWLLYRYKNTAFSAEQEWRLMSDISRMPPGGSKDFRVSSLGVVPYYEWKSENLKEKLPVLSVMVGPSPFAQVSDLGLKIFLETSGYDVPTEYSTIPIRR